MRARSYLLFQEQPQITSNHRAQYYPQAPPGPNKDQIRLNSSRACLGPVLAGGSIGLHEISLQVQHRIVPRSQKHQKTSQRLKRARSQTSLKRAFNTSRRRQKPQQEPERLLYCTYFRAPGRTAARKPLNTRMIAPPGRSTVC